MITQYRFSIQSLDNQSVSSERAYAIYSWLLTKIPASYGDMLHQQGEKPISQYIYYHYHHAQADKTNQIIWTVSCLNQEISDVLEPVLKNLDIIPLHSGNLKATCLEHISISSVGELHDLAERDLNSRYLHLSFHSPTAFKHDGQYIIFPEKRLLLRSLAEKWDYAFPAYPIRDEETLNAIENGVKITDYRLQSCRFALKNIRVPGFSGQIILQSNLAPPLMKLWNSFIYFSSFSGIGMKTTLGMGGVKASMRIEK